jgi:hypothetical protein
MMAGTASGAETVPAHPAVQGGVKRRGECPAREGECRASLLNGQPIWTILLSRFASICATAVGLAAVVSCLKVMVAA